MSLFLSPSEAEAFHHLRKSDPVAQEMFWALLNRVDQRVRKPGLIGPEGGADWWFCVAEYLSDAAMAYALKPSENTAAWLRSTTLDVVRRGVEDWVGPHFRDHQARPHRGHLETSHLSWSVSSALDLAPDVFTETERMEIAAVLRDRAIPLCREWLENNNHMANWRCVLAAGEAVAAAVLDERDAIERAVREYEINLQSFQEDGSYGESLQYSNYPALHLMLAREALMRRDPGLAAKLPAAPWALLPRWYAASLLYVKPLDGWGAAPRPRCANFNDSSAIFRPSGDLLLHLAAREKENTPREAGLARWLFDTLYANDLSVGPHDGASFGFVNDWGFLAPVFLPQARAALSPEAAGLDPLETFDNGDVLVRDRWQGKTTVAIHGGGAPLNGPGHLHGDLNSFILAHNHERLLVDPGHSCYRNLTHALEVSSLTHNTCTFIARNTNDLGLQEDKHGLLRLQQSNEARVHFDRSTGKRIAPADRGARRLLAERLEEVTVVGSDAAGLYDSRILKFSRFWVLCGTHALFVIDQIESDEPVQTAWHWLLNNRDDLLDYKVIHPDRIVARRPGAGMKLFHLAGGLPETPEYAFVHDAYYTSPSGRGEGRTGSGILLTWREPASLSRKKRTAIHAFAIDSYGAVAGWHLKTHDGLPALESPGGNELWAVNCPEDSQEFHIHDLVGKRKWTVQHADAGCWTLNPGA